MQPAFREADFSWVETDPNQETWSPVSSLVERGQNQSFGAEVYSVEETDLNQNPEALDFYAVEEKDRNQRLSGSHLQNGILPVFFVVEKDPSHTHICSSSGVMNERSVAHSQVAKSC